MVDACLTVTQSKEYVPIWKDKEPEDFTTDFDQLQTSYATLMAKCALAEFAVGGAADTKALAETTLEDQTYVLSRALSSHFKKTKDLTRLAQVDVTRTEIMKLRENDLVTKATAIRDLAAAVQFETDAGKRGVSALRVATLSAAISAFKTAMATPRGQIVNRSTLLKEIETDAAALMEQVSDLDDLVLQFDGTEQGERFVEAWKRARMIIDRPGETSAKISASTKAPAPSDIDS
jgi:hypothetical protein